MTDTELRIYNEASAATVAGSRLRLSNALWSARALDKRIRRPPQAERLLDKILYHCNFIGWPIRLRPNGRYL